MSSPSSFKENFFWLRASFSSFGQHWGEKVLTELKKRTRESILEVNFKKVYSNIICSLYGSFNARRHKFWNTATFTPTCNDSLANYPSSSKQNTAAEKGKSAANRHLTFPSPVSLLSPISNHDCSCFAAAQKLECAPRKSCLCNEEYHSISA